MEAFRRYSLTVRQLPKNSEPNTFELHLKLRPLNIIYRIYFESNQFVESFSKQTSTIYCKIESSTDLTPHIFGKQKITTEHNECFG